MIVLATDYGCCSPYQAQLIAAVKRYAEAHAGELTVISLFSDLAKFRPDLAAYLLPQYFEDFPEQSVFVFVVDPGVGSQQRDPLLVRYRQYWLVCAGDDLLKVLTSRRQRYQAWRIVWQPPRLSKSFHGRDLFAPVAASIALGQWHEEWYQQVPALDLENVNAEWPEDLAKIVYIDEFGNAMTGIRARPGDERKQLEVANARLSYGEVFSAVGLSQCFFYVNSMGLIEIAANQDSAAKLLHLGLGQTVEMIS